MSRWRRAGSFIALAAAAIGAGRLSRLRVAEESMAPALQPGDSLLGVPVGRVRRGDVVVYPDMGLLLVKRVVGLPGETVTIAGGQVHVDGAPLAEPWADGPTLGTGEWQLEDEVFVLGDARSRSSHDSRQLGPVARADLMHRAIARYRPLRTARIIRRQPR